MEDGNWKRNLSSLFEDIKIIEKSKRETLENFNQFWEFIAEPALENLKKALKPYKVKAKYRRLKGNVIHFKMNFPGSSIDDFHYIISLPRNSVELKLKLRIRGRPDRYSPFEEKEEQFMANVPSSEILKLNQNDIINDIIEHYRNFKYTALTRPD